jgi:hypothetical protein
MISAVSLVDISSFRFEISAVTLVETTSFSFKISVVCLVEISSFKYIKDETYLNIFSKNKMFFKIDTDLDLGRIIWRSKINTLLELEIEENFLEKCLNNNLNIKSASSKPIYTINMI